MQYRLPFFLRVVVLLLWTPSAASSTEPGLGNEDVVRMTDADVGPNAIVAKIEKSAGDYSTDVDALIELAAAGVDDRVMAAMVRAGAAVAVTPVGEDGSSHFGDFICVGGALAAAVLGALVAFWLTRTRDRDFRTFELVRLYQTTFNLHGRTLLHLSNWLKGTTPSSDKQNEVRLMGNWLDIMAALIVKKRVDERLVDDLGIRTAIQCFNKQVSSNSKVQKALNAGDWKFVSRV